MNKTFTITIKADFSDLVETLNTVSDKAYLEAKGITTSILEDKLFYIRDIPTVIPVKGLANIQSKEGYIIAEYDNSQKCVGLIIRTETDTIRLKTEHGTAFYNETHLQYDDKLIYICDDPLIAVSLENNSESAVYISDSQQRKFIEYIEKSNILASFIITSDKLNTVRKGLSDKSILCEKYIFDEKCILDDNAVIEYIMECKSIIENRRLDYGLKNSAYGNLEKFKSHIEQNKGKNTYPTSFKKLDTALQGGLRVGVIYIGAISSLGKTTFTLQMADQLAKNGHDVMIFSLEMSKYELMAKSISRETYKYTRTKKDCIKYAKTMYDILDDNINDVSESAVVTSSYNNYSKYADNIYIFEGKGRVSVEQINRYVRQHIRYRKKKPIVIIDYLQILKPENAHMSDKQAVDNNVSELKQLSMDNDIPVVAISSFNRENYHAPVSMLSFKESGSIEYSSDVMIGLQFKGMDYKDDEKSGDREKRIRELVSKNNEKKKTGGPIDIQLKILKNRGLPNESIDFKFVAKYNYFEEAETKEDSWI